MSVSNMADAFFNHPSRRQPYAVARRLASPAGDCRWFAAAKKMSLVSLRRQGEIGPAANGSHNA
jgi:hypothetical protein